MKQFLILLVALFGTFTVFIACDDDNNGKLEGFAKIYIQGKNITNKFLHENADGSQRLLSIEEICKGDSVSIEMEHRLTGATSSHICVITPIEDCPAYGAIDTINMRLALNAENIENIHAAAEYFDNSYKTSSAISYILPLYSLISMSVSNNRLCNSIYCSSVGSLVDVDD